MIEIYEELPHYCFKLIKKSKINLTSGIVWCSMHVKVVGSTVWYGCFRLTIDISYQYRSCF